MVCKGGDGERDLLGEGKEGRVPEFGMVDLGLDPDLRDLRRSRPPGSGFESVLPGSPMCASRTHVDLWGVTGFRDEGRDLVPTRCSAVGLEVPGAHTLPLWTRGQIRSTVGRVCPMIGWSVFPCDFEPPPH